VAALAAESDANLSPEETGLDPENLAYVIYTSARPAGPRDDDRAPQPAHRLLRLRAGLPAGRRHRPPPDGEPLLDVFTGDFIRPWAPVPAWCSAHARCYCSIRSGLFSLMRGERVDGAEFVPAVVRTLVDHLGQADPADTSLDFIASAGGQLRRLVCREVAALPVCAAAHSADRLLRRHRGDDRHHLPAARRGRRTPCLPVSAAAAVVPIGRPLSGNEVWVLGGVDCCHHACPASCASAAMGWRAAISAGRS